MSLTKADLIDTIYNRVDPPKTKSTQVVESLLEIVNVPIGDIHKIIGFIQLRVNMSATLPALFPC